ncbi:MAG: DUF2219 family protein [Thiogranum sp.]|nr:DUF2219 family protein [Thiogranum sp.]
MSLTPLGFGLTHRATLAPADRAAASLYGSLVVRATAVVQDLFLDGNSFRDSHSVDKEPLIGQAVAGLHYERQNWSVHFNLLIPTTRVDTNDAPDVDGNSELAALVFEWHY